MSQKVLSCIISAKETEGSKDVNFIKRYGMLLPGIFALLANGVPFITHPVPFLGLPCGIFILSASAFSAGLGIFAVHRGNKMGWWAITLGLIAIALGAFLPGLFVVRESAHAT